MNWPNVVFAAEAAQEPFEDVNIITALGLFVDTAFQAAADLVYTEGHTLTQEKVQSVAFAMIADRKIMVQEHVRVNADGITVCINVPDVNDEAVQWQALDRVASALDSLNGCTGVVVFSDNLYFNVNQVTATLA